MWSLEGDAASREGSFACLLFVKIEEARAYLTGDGRSQERGTGQRAKQIVLVGEAEGWAPLEAGLSAATGGNVGNMAADIEGGRCWLQFSQLTRRQGCLVGAGLGRGSETWGK